VDTILSTVLYIFSSCCLLAAFLSPSAAPPREIHIIRKELEIHMGSFKRAGRSTYMYCTVHLLQKKKTYWLIGPRHLDGSFIKPTMSEPLRTQ
jgi:hypothetical protein